MPEGDEPAALHDAVVGAVVHAVIRLYRPEQSRKVGQEEFVADKKEKWGLKGKVINRGFNTTVGK